MSCQKSLLLLLLCVRYLCVNPGSCLRLLRNNNNLHFFALTMILMDFDNSIAEWARMNEKEKSGQRENKNLVRTRAWKIVSPSSSSSRHGERMRMRMMFFQIGHPLVSDAGRVNKNPTINQTLTRVSEFSPSSRQKCYCMMIAQSTSSRCRRLRSQS